MAGGPFSIPLWRMPYGGFQKRGEIQNAKYEDQNRKLEIKSQISKRLYFKKGVSGLNKLLGCDGGQGRPKSLPYRVVALLNSARGTPYGGFHRAGLLHRGAIKNLFLVRARSWQGSGVQESAMEL